MTSNVRQAVSSTVVFFVAAVSIVPRYPVAPVNATVALEDVLANGSEVGGKRSSVNRWVPRGRFEMLVDVRSAEVGGLVEFTSRLEVQSFGIGWVKAKATPVPLSISP